MRLKFLLLILGSVTGVMVVVVGIGYGLSKILPLSIFEFSELLMLSGIFIGIVFLIGSVEESRRYSSSMWTEEGGCYCPVCAKEKIESMIGKQKMARNDFCYCGSGKKYKNCCMKQDVA